MPKRHELKTWPEYFNAIKSHGKLFEVRKNDRDYHTGDTLVLKCYDSSDGKYVTSEPSIERTVTFVLHGGSFGIERGYVVMGLSDPDDAEINRLRLRERQCDAACGADQLAAAGWYRARDEWGLDDDGPYEAIKRLRGQVAALREVAAKVERFLDSDQIGKFTYMESMDFYTDCDSAIHELQAARAATAPEGGK